MSAALELIFTLVASVLAVSWRLSVILGRRLRELRDRDEVWEMVIGAGYRDPREDARDESEDDYARPTRQEAENDR